MLKYRKKPNPIFKPPITNASSPQNLFSKKRFSPCFVNEKTLYPINVMNTKVAKKPLKNTNQKKETVKNTLTNKKNKVVAEKNENKKELNLISPPLINTKRLQEQNQVTNKKDIPRAIKDYLSPRNNQEVKFAEQEIIKRTINDYRIIREIGQGAYAIVKEAIDKKTNVKVAIKVYDKAKLLDSQQKKSINSEIQVLKILSHNNIVKFMGSIDNTKELLLVMEFVEGESLYSYLKSKNERRLGEDETRGLFRQILLAIQYCHKRNIAHRDIKLENILLTDHYTIKIIDFGFSIYTPHRTKLKNFCGTPSYMAPEIVTKKEYNAINADMWALGILLFTLVSGRFPFKGSNDKELFKQIAKGEFTFSSRTSEKCQSFIKRFLQMEPEKRIDCDEALKDPFMINSDKIPQVLSLSYNKDIIKKIVINLIKNRLMKGIMKNR